MEKEIYRQIISKVEKEKQIDDIELQANTIEEKFIDILIDTEGRERVKGKMDENDIYHFCWPEKRSHYHNFKTNSL